MKPGRELDATVAEAMGWQDIQPNTDPPYGTHPNGTTAVIPYYSIHWPDAAKAWEWLEKNNPWNESLIMGRLHRQQGFDPFVGRYGLDDIIAWGDTYPHAICLAVLATKESDKL